MHRTEVIHYKVRERANGRYALIAQLRSYGSIGPDPGRVERETPVVEDVTRDYAEMLAREFTKWEHAPRLFERQGNNFTVARQVGRLIDLFVGHPDNATLAERVKNPLVF